MQDEFTEEMHATFWVTDEEDKQHRVWAAASMDEEDGYPLEEALRLQQVTLADYEKYFSTHTPPG